MLKKLNKRSSFNVQSPVGTAGIRGTIPYFQVSKGNDGSIQQVTSMLKGEIAFTPKGAQSSTLLGPDKAFPSVSEQMDYCLLHRKSSTDYSGFD